MKSYKTIIIGGGISGIGCVNTLLDNDEEFLLISPDLGGRIIESESHCVEYGAYYVMDIYHNTVPFVKRGRRIKPSKIRFHNLNKGYSLFNKKIFFNFFELIRLIFLLKKFKKHYELFKKNSIFKSQVNCLRENDYLFELYNMNAKEFVKSNNIKNIVNDYLSEIIHGTTFSRIEELNAFTFLQFSLPLIVPVYEFIFRKKIIEEKLGKKYFRGKVSKIINKNNGFIVKTEKEEFFCNNLVVATSPEVAKKLLNLLQELRKPVNAHMFHIKGVLRKDWLEGEDNVFNQESNMLAIAHQVDDTYLFYCKNENPDFNKYFLSFNVIRHKFWNPAFHIGGSNLIDFIQGNNLFLIGDNNICGLEDAYIYGVYAANKILGKTLD